MLGEVTVAVTVMLRVCDAVCGVLLESVTRTVTEAVLDRVGVPLICPVDEFRLNPGGKVPEPIAQKYGAVPPLAAIVALYATPV
jgi:hypothetical protein